MFLATEDPKNSSFLYAFVAGVYLFSLCLLIMQDPGPTYFGSTLQRADVKGSQINVYSFCVRLVMRSKDLWSGTSV